MGTTAYTDGACQGNPGPGGWAWAVPGGRWASGAEAASTNQRMEIKAALDAVESLDGPLLVVSDSTYVVNCFRDRWWAGWIARGWVNKAKKPIANQDLWKPLIELVNSRGDVTFSWVKGHSGDTMNDLVDRLAVEAAARQQGRSGTGDPGPLGPADVVRPGSVEAPAGALAVPVGHLVAVGGHRPPGLGGFDDNPVADGARRKLREVLEAKATLHPDLIVLTGLGLGAEQLAAEAAAEAGVPYVAVLPFPEPDVPWPATSKARFRSLLEGAAGRVVLDPTAPSTKQRAGAALGRRDAWLARNADEAIVVWDRDDRDVGRLVRSYEDHLGETEVWVVEP
ncbi:MAG: ribonuclease H [Acidimicrobiales bacterium]